MRKNTYHLSLYGLISACHESGITDIDGPLMSGIIADLKGGKIAGIASDLRGRPELKFVPVNSREVRVYKIYRA